MIESERSLYEDRVLRFIRRLENLVYEETQTLRIEYRLTKQPVSFDQRHKRRYVPIRKGEIWGKAWDSAWFHLEGEVPHEWKGKEVVAIINLTGEACLFDHSGMPLQGVAGHSLFGHDFIRERFDLFRPCKGGEGVNLWIEAVASGLFGIHLKEDPPQDDPERYGSFEAKIREANMAVFRQDIWHLLLDVRVLGDLMRALPQRSVRRSRILYALNEAIDIFQVDTDSVNRSRKRLEKVLSKPASASDLRTQAVGHAHIDTAWLWTVSESVRKCARSFANQMALMEKYPFYVFGASQAQHYLFVKEHYPLLYRKIKQKVASGQWEIQGGMWVEADCNLISGESMVRQILHGKNFFKEEFGVEVRNLWLPDVFGYSAALPQILKKAGIHYLVTQKISWNQFNRFPHHTFLWRGIDGTEIIAHFPPEDTYKSRLSADKLRYAQENFAEKGFLDEFLTLFGMSDGGGGPTEEYIEMGLRQQNLEGAPHVGFGPAQTMLDRLKRHRHRLETWTGELYLELHRGTLTSQARNKKMNRRLESRLRQAEFFFSCLPLDSYPSQDLDRMWKILLLNQFHDILPGSGIRQVYEESLGDYAKIDEMVSTLVAKAVSQLFRPKADALCIVNTSSYAYNQPVKLPHSWLGHEVGDENGRRLPVQKYEGVPVTLVRVDPLSARNIYKKSKARNGKCERKSGFKKARPILENDLVRYQFGADGTIAHAWDKEANREIVSDPGNLLCLYEDRPVSWDAWDVDMFYQDQWLEQAELISWQIAAGPIQRSMSLSFRIGRSAIEQEAVLGQASKRLDFVTTVHWKEQHKMLRVAFFVAVHAPKAKFDIQFGITERPTHNNTSWDRAQFEVCGHRFADLSQDDYGVALLNDCKYGYKVRGNELNLNLLRSPTYPDPDADRGIHTFTYSLMPHRGSLENSSVWAEAAQLNQPLEIIEGHEAQDFRPPVTIEGRGVVFETLKKAENEDSLILRAYETRGCSATACLRLNRPLLSCRETDLMETEEREPCIESPKVELVFKPFEIRTFKIRKKKR